MMNLARCGCFNPHIRPHKPGEVISLSCIGESDADIAGSLQSWSKYLAQVADVYDPFQNRHCQLSISTALPHPRLQCCNFWGMN